MNVRIWRLITVCSAVVVCALVFGKVMFHPDEYMFSSRGDGVKNYFTWAWHIRYDSSWLHFGGTNMPFGEHVCYSDGHPLLALLIGWIPWVKAHPVGTLNVAMLLSFPLATWVLFEVAVRHHFLPWIACLAALCITWMNPQIYRMEGHYALSYAFWIPLLMLLWSAQKKGESRPAFLGMSIAIISAFFTHPYLGMMMSLFLLSLTAVEWMADGRIYYSSRKMVKSLASAIIPLIVYVGFIRLTDTHADRAGMGQGFLEYTASYETVFVPHDQPFRHMVSQVIKVHKQVWEGWAYVGMATTLIILVFGSRWVMRKTHMSRRTSLLFFGSLPVLFFSFGWPFTWGLESLLDQLPMVQQFRAPGRFAWVFYYAATLFAFGVLSVWWENRKPEKSKVLRMSVIVATVMLFVIEGFIPLKGVSNRISLTPNLFREEGLPALWRQQSAELSSWKTSSTVLLPIPFYHYGSDYYGRSPVGDMQKWTMALAFHTGIPLVASGNPRVSLSESKAMLSSIYPMAPGCWLSERADVWAIRGAGLDSLMQWDERMFWKKTESGYRGASIEVRRPPATYSNPLIRSDISELGIFEESTAKELNLPTQQYVIAGTWPMDVFSDTLMNALELDLGSKDALDLLEPQVIIQLRKGKEVKWVAYYPIRQSSGFFENSVRTIIPFTIEPGYNSLEVVFYHESGRPLQLRLKKMRMVVVPE